MTPKESAKVIFGVLHDDWFSWTPEVVEAFNMAISALEKQEQSCDTCRHGRFGDEACINCRVGFPNHYEAEEDNGTD